MGLKAEIKEKHPDFYMDLCAAKDKLIRLPLDLYCRVNLKKAVEHEYDKIVGGKINWDNPKSIDEKMSVLKLGEYYNNPLVTECTDKVKVKEYIDRNNIPLKYAKTLAVYKRAKDLDWEALPKQFVIKCNHGCQYNIIVDDKDKYSEKSVKKKLNHWMHDSYWTRFAEPIYRFVEKKIMVEEYLGYDIATYKYYCFNGESKIMYISHNGPRGPVLDKEEFIDYYDMDFNWIDIRLRGTENLGPESNTIPEHFHEMRRLAEDMAKGFPLVRVDFYEVNGEIYLSEMTFLPSGGYMRFIPPETLDTMGDWLTL